jgi:hypothetical protein
MGDADQLTDLVLLQQQRTKPDQRL